MISGALDAIVGGLLSVFMLLLGLLPTIDISSLPIAPPPLVQQALGCLNMFINFADLITIITVWIVALIAINVFLIVSKLFESFK